MTLLPNLCSRLLLRSLKTSGLDSNRRIVLILWRPMEGLGKGGDGVGGGRWRSCLCNVPQDGRKIGEKKEP